MTRKAKRHDTPVDDTALQPVRDIHSPEPDISFLLSDLRDLIRAAKGRAATAINIELVLLYWHIGDRIGRDILKKERAPYGKKILSTLSKELIAEYGPGYSQPNLTRMIRFAALFPSEELVSTVSKELSWSHFVELLQIEDAVAREFYVQICRIERWSVRELHSKIQGMLFERTALSRKPEELARQELAVLREEGRVTPVWFFAIRICLISSGLPIPTANGTSRQRSSGSSNGFCWNSEPGLHLLHVRSGLALMGRIITSTCYFTTAGCAGWWRST